MLFSDFIKILQNHYKNSIGDHELCSLLFDFVIEPAELYTSNGNLIYINKGVVSKLLNGTAKIPRQIRDHIYDGVVIDSLVSKFDDSVVPELNPDIEDLCFQIMSLIERDSISDVKKSDFRMLANEKTIAAFLAKAFIYVVVNNVTPGVDISPDDDLEEENLVLKGIIDNQTSDQVVFRDFYSVTGLSRDNILKKIADKYDLVNSMHLKRKPVINSQFKLNVKVFPSYEMGKDEKEMIEKCAENLSIILSDDFFDFGDLSLNPVAGFSKDFGVTSSYVGTDEEKAKAQAVDDIFDMIQEYLNIAPFIIAYEDKHFLPLAVINNGATFDEDVRIKLRIDKDSLYSAEDIANEQYGVAEFITEEIDYSDLFGIKKGINYLNYSESETLKPGRIRSSSPHPNKQKSKSELIDAIQEELGFFYIESGDDYILEIVIDGIILAGCYQTVVSRVL